MENNLWTFGCSFTQGFLWSEFADSKNPMISYYEYMGNQYPKTWTDILAEKLKLTPKNKGYSGSSCYKIFDKFCIESENFKKGDVIIFEWTRIHRFRAVQDGKFPTVLPVFDDTTGTFPIPINAIKEIQVNRTERPFIEELYSYENLIEEICKSYGCEVYFWSADDQIINSENQDFKKRRKYLLPESNEDIMRYLITKRGAKTITKETNSLVMDDQHYGKEGHEVMAEVFFEEIIKYRNLIHE